MRYWKGSIALSSTRDYPILRHVLQSGLVSHNQLFEFSKLDYCASSRNAFNNRVLRLVQHGLLLRHDGPLLATRDVVYSISEIGAAELVSKGECFPSSDCNRIGQGLVQLRHSLDLNEIHLALKRTGTLVYWTPEAAIRSQNDLTAQGYCKYYDAVVTVRLAREECKFALEYERTPKSARQYEIIRQRIEMEAWLTRFVYLASNYDVLCLVVEKLKNCKRELCFGLLRDFLQQTLGMSVRTNGSPVSLTLASVLTHGSETQHTGRLFPHIAV